ncbi:MAG: glutamine cyclotransferase [Roseivirga sp.]|jgi:glutamine cyclotransferase
MRLLIACICTFFLVAACGPTKEKRSLGNPELISFKVEQTMKHDTAAYTQGFLIHEGQIFESTGQEGSWIGIVNPKTGTSDKKVILDDQYFGEGITILNNKIYQLTWQEKTGFVYDLDSYELIKEFSYPMEGWGLTDDGKDLIMSDGSNSLYFLDTTNFSVSNKMSVTYQGVAVSSINELEYVDGYIWANIYQKDLIAKIDAKTGKIEAFLDLSDLTYRTGLLNPSMDVLNGIAWHESTQSLLVTGKLWPLIYVLKLTEDKDTK